MREIILPETKPALEWVNGRALQKASPKRQHAVAQARFASALLTWAHAHKAGVVGTEWRFLIKPQGEERRPLVPDVAFLSYSRMSKKEQMTTEEPRVAPEVVVEVLSPGDRSADVDEKIRVYLKAGTSVVFLVDPKERVVTVCEPAGRRVVPDGEHLTHDALPHFDLPISELFTLP
jgi:Uma2 family endonuclease